MSGADNGRILCFATQGQGHIEGERIRGLLEPLGPDDYAFDRGNKIRSAVGLVRAVRARRPALIVMEGTGTAGGLTLIALDAVVGIPFILSSGDAVGPYLRLHSRLLGLLGGLYERLLCRRCAGYVGWTPYLVGRALTFGAPRGMTAPGWTRSHAADGARERIRAQLGIPPDALVVGLVGSLHWNEHVGYAYGAELVRAIRRVERRDVLVCIVGDGSGRPRLERMAGEDLGSRVLLPGRVPARDVPDYLAAFDVGSLSQSVDGVGSFRYTTKLSEYLASELPILTGEIPAAYDLDEGCMWRLPGASPWSSTYVDALAEFLEGLSAVEIARRREAIRERRGEPFDKLAQQRRMSAFVRDILAERARADDRG
ncbi:MAG TPA: glycosyltransferase [Solirubrobacteraceae bacterium]|jgi:glycosyltransferase involved in cell wall biosynthesis|nr:glycosyltransferase [Solirubrobacteraceae bacterium]